MTFSELGLAETFHHAFQRLHYRQATPIQAQAIPAILQQRDILGIAPTGSGKTASYLLPILQQLENSPARDGKAQARVLVLVPTRELAEQVAANFQEFIPCLQRHRKCLAVYGGVSINPQMQSMGSAEILIATPGRLIELISKKAVQLSHIHTLVLDEADKMLHLGFQAELKQLLERLPHQRQNLLFSATLSDDLSSIQQVVLKNPLTIKIEAQPDALDCIQQLAIRVSEERKGPLLRYLIKEGPLEQVLIFVCSKVKADRVAEKLNKNHIKARATHSHMSQSARRSALQQFKSGQLPVLVATDLLARGIDIEFLPCVINYELPRSPKDYIHRIGRTGRAENPGDAISFISPEELHHFGVIQKKMGQEIPLQDSDELDLHGY